MKLLFGLLLALLHLWLSTGYPVDYKKMAHLAPIVNEYKHKLYAPQLRWSFKCFACKQAASLFHTMAVKEEGFDKFKNLALGLCKKFHIFDDRVCTLGVEEWGADAWGVFTDGVLAEEQVCGILLGDGCVKTTFGLHEKWLLDIPPQVESMVAPVEEVRRIEEDSLSRVLHLSDIHLDWEYTQGSKVDCGEPLCCRKSDGKAGKHEGAAPKWGYVGYCDTSPTLAHNLMNHLKSTLSNQIDYIMWTGDIPAHNVWNQSRTDQITVLSMAVDMLKETFPNLKVYPALGNHESSPVNSFPPPSITDKYSNKWLLEALAEKWGTWLPASTRETIEKGGFYSVLVTKGFRIVSLNMNYMSEDNWWLNIDSKDPAGQLQWLVGVLLQAEKDGEKVHIIGHIPPGGGLYWWNWNYYRIVDRFHETITGQFFGHTHNDHFKLFFDMETLTKPINIAYIAPSVTTFPDLYPGYRIYDIEGSSVNSTKMVLNHETYIFNLTEVNSSDKPDWNLEYSAKEHYGMDSLQPNEWDGLLHRMLTNETLFDSFYSFYYKSSTKAKAPCDEACRYAEVCSCRSMLGLHDKLCNFDNGLDFDMFEKLKEIQHREASNC